MRAPMRKKEQEYHKAGNIFLSAPNLRCAFDATSLTVTSVARIKHSLIRAKPHNFNIARNTSLSPFQTPNYAQEQRPQWFVKTAMGSFCPLC